MDDMQIFGMNFGLFVSEVGLLVTGLAAIIGIWVERDPERPIRYAVWLSSLVTLATAVGMYQCWSDDKQQAKLEGDLARIIHSLDGIAHESEVEVPVLNGMLKGEISAQARSNPRVMAAVAQRVADAGGDPAAMMASYLPDHEVQALHRSGRLAAGGRDACAPALASAGKPRRQLDFGTGPARMRAEPPPAPAPPPPAPPPPPPEGGADAGAPLDGGPHPHGSAAPPPERNVYEEVEEELHSGGRRR